ncbi:MAG: hypothetical protein ACI8ZN_001576 [Bacteroidia bacterium]|jgi:hypothetical protein
MENFVLLQTYFTGIEAQGAKNTLASYNIFSEIIGEMGATMYNVFTPAQGGIRLFVHEKDAEKAAKVLG